MYLYADRVSAYGVWAGFDKTRTTEGTLLSRSAKEAKVELLRPLPSGPLS